MAREISSDTLRLLYVTMLRLRHFEERVADLLANGPSIKCPTHLYIGQEAVAAGVCANLRGDDYVFSTHRSHGHYLAKGGDLTALMAELYGKASGCSRGWGGSMHVAAREAGLPGSSAIVAGTIPIAVGAAMAFKMQKKSSVSVAFFGDGAANEGVFYEALNFASLKKLPVIFICENNLYSTHMPIEACLADIRIYKKAEAFAMPGIRIDGNDVVEVFKVSGEAIEAARRGKGPALLECMTYRWRGHVGPNYDLDKGLRSQEELDRWMSRCPIRTLERFLLEQGILSESEKEKLCKSIEQEVTEAIDLAWESPYPNQAELFANVFKDTKDS